jgi:hypothetical protein
MSIPATAVALVALVALVAWAVLVARLIREEPLGWEVPVAEGEPSAQAASRSG